MIHKLKEYFLYSFKNLKHRKTRTWLTMLGIFIGIATIVSLISLGQGLEKTINEQFEMVGSDKIFITTGSTYMTTQSSSYLTKDDLNTIKKIKGVDEVTGGVYSSAKIQYKDQIKYMLVISLPTDEGVKLIEEMSGFDVVYGRELKSGDKQKVTLGNYFMQEGKVFDEVVDPGKKIFINDIPFDVVGIYDVIGNPQDDSNVIIPEDYMREMFNMPEREDYIFVRVEKGEDVKQVAERIESKLRKKYNLEEGEEFFNVQTYNEVLDSFNKIIGIVKAVLIGLAIISLVVGGIGIMNTMFTSVLQRTNEIGIMKSIGAKNSDILFLFLIESGMLGVAGGIIGIILGFGIAWIVEYGIYVSLGTRYLQAYVGWELIFGALIFSFFVGVLSGIVPAIRASKMNPIDAIGYKK